MRIEDFDIEAGEPTYIEERRAGITAWFDTALEKMTLFELKAEPTPLRRAATAR